MPVMFSDSGGTVKKPAASTAYVPGGPGYTGPSTAYVPGGPSAGGPGYHPQSTAYVPNGPAAGGGGYHPASTSTYKAPAPVYHAPQPTYSAPKRSTSTASSGGGGGGSIAPAASNFISSAPVEPPPPVMQDITIPDAAADTNYQKTVADLARAAVDYKAQQGLQRSQYDTQYNDAERRMGWDQGLGQFNRHNPGAYSDSMNADEGDFAGRGMIYSGAYGQSVGDINRDFGDRKSSLDTARADNVDTQNQALSSFTGQQDATRNAAMTDAVAKIAAQLGVSLGDVPQGTGSKVIQRPVG